MAQNANSACLIPTGQSFALPIYGALAMSLFVTEPVLEERPDRI